MARLSFLLAPLLIAGYLYALWSDWFTDAEMNAVAKRPLYSEILNLREIGSTVWAIAPERLAFARGHAQLSLSLNINAMREIPESREKVDLRVKIIAEGRQPNGQWQNRLLLDPHYYKTDEPFSRAGDGIWESWGLGRGEFGLCAVEVIPGEEVRVTMTVQVPDGRLMTGLPRLKLIAKHGPGDEIYPALMRLALRDFGFWMSLALVGWLSFAAWRGWRHRPLSEAEGRLPVAEPKKADGFLIGKDE